MNNVIARTPTRARHNVVARYSNADGLGTGTSGSGIDWGGIINTGIRAVEGTLLGIFGKGDKYQLLAQQRINDEQRKTTMILWAIIGIVLVVGAIILIRKK